MRSLQPLALCVALACLPGCLIYDLVTLNRLHKERLGDGGPFAQQIHIKMHSDNEPGTTVFYTGNLPAAFDNLDDKRVRLTAKAEMQTVSLTFQGMADGKVCFTGRYHEEVVDDGEGEAKRVDDLFRSFDFGAELVGPESAPEVAKRNHVFPRDNYGKLDSIELVSSRTKRAKSNNLHRTNTYELCGQAPPVPKTQPAFLTVAVKANNSDSHSAFLLVWQLYRS